MQMTLSTLCGLMNEAKKNAQRSDVDKEQNLITQKTAEKAWVTTK